MKRGAKTKFETSKGVVKALKNLNSLSRFLKLQLVDKGFVKVVKRKSEGRGRPVHDYEVTGKGRGLVALSKNWK